MAKGDAAAKAEQLASWLRRGGSLVPVVPDDAVCPHTGADNAEALEKLIAADPLAEAQPRFPGLAIDPDAVVLGSLVLLGSIERQTSDQEHKQRMRRAAGRKLAHLHQLLALEDVGPYRLLGALCSEWTPAQKTTLLIELAALDPFAPFQISWAIEHRNAGLAAIAEVIGLTAADAQRVIDTFEDASRAHRDISLLRVGLYTAGGAAAVGTLGLLAAPMVGGALGAATGLGGAAATSHGLALIGGLAGTHSMAAGAWVLAQAGAVAGAVGAGGGSALFQLGAAQAQSELIKLQVAAKLVLVDLQHNDAAAHQIATELKQRVGDLESLIEAELLTNDPDSPRIKNLRRNHRATEAASVWVDGHCDDDDGGLVLNVAATAESIDAFIESLRTQEVFASLEEPEQARIEREFSASFRITAGLDRWDVGLAIAAGIVAAVIDTFAVAAPRNSQLTARLRSLASDSDNWLAKVAKVPFDQSIGDGFTPKNHRTLTPGHDLLLGLVWGTWDILGSTMTRTYKDGGLAVVPRPGHTDIDSVGRALVLEIAHLASDVVSPAGLPLPGWTALAIHPELAEAAVKAYTRGYDTWHAPAMSVPGASIRTMVWAYTSLRGMGDPDFAEAVAGGLNSPRVRAIELIAFGVASAADLAQLMTGSNPLTANYVQWLTLARRIAMEAHARAESITDVLVSDLTVNQLKLTNGWALLIGESEPQ